MLQRHLSYRIALIVSLSVLVVESALSVFGFFQQRRTLLSQKVDQLNWMASSLEEELAQALQTGQTDDLSLLVSKVARPFKASAAAVFDNNGNVLYSGVFSPGYAGSWADLEPKLRLSENKKDSVGDVLQKPQGTVFRYITPIRDFSERPLGGLSLEIPLSFLNTGLGSYLLKSIGRIGLVLLLTNAILTPILILVVVRPIREVAEELEHLAKGDAHLAYRIQIPSKDELGQLVFWFNDFLGNIRALIMTIRDHCEKLMLQVQGVNQSTLEVGAMGEDVSVTIQQISKGAEEQANKIGEVHQLMQQTQATSKEVEKKAQEAATAVDRAIHTARAGGKLAQSTIQKMSHLNETILSNSEVMHSLGEKSLQIGRVVDLISGIADQTNLLSLNAAIEAARAGEQGKGFAVVAEEIRTLADGASKATKEITQLIQEIQEETQTAVSSMEKGAAAAEESKEVIHRMGDSLQEIITVVENVVDHSKEITEMVALQIQHYDKVVHGIQDINAVSEQSAASTQEVSASTEEQSASMEHVKAACSELTHMSGELKALVERFRI